MRHLRIFNLSFIQTITPHCDVHTVREQRPFAPHINRHDVVVVHFYGNINRIRSTICRMEGVCRLGNARRVLVWGAFSRLENLHFQRYSGVFQPELCQKRVENEVYLVDRTHPWCLLPVPKQLVRAADKKCFS